MPLATTCRLLYFSSRSLMVNLMPDPDNMVLEQLRVIRAAIDAMREDMHYIKHRMTSMETAIGSLTAAEANHYASSATRADRVDMRLDRIEKRLDLADA